MTRTRTYLSLVLSAFLAFHLQDFVRVKSLDAWNDSFRQKLFWWQHIPKCGSSFIIPLSSILCPSLPSYQSISLGSKWFEKDYDRTSELCDKLIRPSFGRYGNIQPYVGEANPTQVIIMYRDVTSQRISYWKQISQQISQQNR